MHVRSLLHDQVRDLRKDGDAMRLNLHPANGKQLDVQEHSKLQDLERSLSSALDDSRQRRQSAETRLSRQVS